MLKEFYINVFGNASGKLPDKLFTEDWKEIGFQSKNPRADFRGAGILSLSCLNYFFKYYNEQFNEMLQSGSEYFFIALSSINVTVNSSPYLLALPHGLLLFK